jgi:hypothetical protein
MDPPSSIPHYRITAKLSEGGMKISGGNAAMP